MAGNWQKVPIDLARAHPLYGVGGWLIVFAVGLVLGLIKELGEVRGVAHQAGIAMGDLLSIDDPTVSYLKLVLGLQFLGVVVIYWLMLSKHPSFRKVTTALFLGVWPTAALLGVSYPSPGAGVSLVFGFFSWALSCAVWVTYFHRSQRVRVTFEHCIAANGATDSGGDSQVASPGSFAAPAPAGNADVVSLHHSAMQAQSATISDEELWAVAAQEVDGQDRRAGLWAKAFAEAQGHEPAARANYLKWRVPQLQVEFEARRKQAEEAQAALAGLEKQKAECPVCTQVISLADATCPHCKTSFAMGSPYKPLLRRGQCPNCDAVIPLRSDECPKCRANFGPGSAWKVVPLKT